WHRVLHADGTPVPRLAARQLALLRAEGVRIVGGRVARWARPRRRTLPSVLPGVVLIKACLNGSRSPDQHPAVPASPEQLAAEAQRAVAAGAGALHVHPRAADGSETLDPAACDAAVLALRHACPGVPVGLSTGAFIEPDPARRLELISAWTERPDFAS